MSIHWSKDKNQSAENAIDDVSNEKAINKGISIKTISMITIIIIIVLFLLARTMFSLRDSFNARKAITSTDDEALVVDDELNFDDVDSITPHQSIPNKTTYQNKATDLNEDNNTNIDDYNNEPAPKIIKGLKGLSAETEVHTEASEVSNSANPVSVNPVTDPNTDSNVNSNKTVKAKILDLDPNLSIRRGTFIKCSLRTDLISQISGDIGCIINNDVYSTNGNVLLIEKGSIVNGAFRRVSLNHGDSRIFVLWEEIITPHDITIDINSGASDVLGAQGIDGWVDNHFWTRFGNAILVSLITDASSATASRLEKSDRYNDFSNTADSGANVAKTIIEKSIDIPPTIYKNHGDNVGIYISQNIDFSDVYKLEYKK